MNKLLQICLIMQGGHGWIGGSEYIKNIILALGTVAPDVRSTFELSLLCNETIDANVYKQIESYVNKIYYTELHLKPLTLRNRFIWKMMTSLSKYKQKNPRMEAFFRKEEINFVYPYSSQNSARKSYRSASWIADFQHKYLPQFFTEKELRQRDEGLNHLARCSSTVVLSSKTAESDFHMFFPEASYKTKVLSFKTYPASTWYEGNPQKKQQEYSLPNRFFLISNQFWQHKNHLIVFQALKLLQEKLIYPIVVCTGHIYDHRKPDYSDTILQTIHKLGISNQVYLLGLIPKFDQMQLMRRSLAIIQPSLFEGWSTLIEDARCLGKRMILSDFPVNLEQNPPNSVFFERKSSEHLASFLADWWEHLSPGPNLEQENAARKNNYSEVQAFGYRFLEIAKGC
ncbi:MAG: glycosyltransferase [Rhizonema sp. PD38]|nr:glycosyltransferase [Rhizonema sp. PD38]